MTERITALIPARGGSKGIAKKNIVDLCGKPLIAWSIDFALESGCFYEVIVSTDSLEIADVAKKYGAKVQMRPDNLASDTATALHVLTHAFENYLEGDIVAYLQPTSPFRSLPHLCEAISLIENYDSVVSVTNVPHNMTPESIMRYNESNLEFVAPPEERVFQRQAKPEYVARNGPSILLSKRQTILQKKSLYGERIGGVNMDFLHSLDIDTPEDLVIARKLSEIFTNETT